MSERLSTNGRHAMPDSAVAADMDTDGDTVLWDLSEAGFDLVLVYHPDGACIHVNTRFTELTNCTEESALGEGWLEVLHPADRKQVQREFAEALNAGLPRDLYFRVAAPGEFRRHVCRLHPIHDSAGQIRRWLASASDVHDLWVADETLEQLGRQQSELLGGLAHDALNPLAPIVNSIELLRLSTPQNAQTQRAIDIIASQVKHLRHLFDNLLDSTHILRGKTTLKLERVDVDELFHDALAQARPLLAAWGQHLAVELPALPAGLRADRRRLGQIIASLIHHGAFASPDGATLRVAARVADGVLEMRVEQENVNVDQERWPLAFELVTLPGAVRGRLQQFSLTLASVRKLVEMHGGNAQAHCRDGRAALVVRLPIPATDAPRSALGEGRSATPAVSRRVLLVGPDRGFIDECTMLLRVAGHDVRNAYECSGALVALQSFDPHILALDLGVPERDALGFAQQFRRLGEPRSVLVGLMMRSGEQERLARKLDCTLVFAKPIQMREFLNAIAEVEPIVAMK